ncbi:phosphoglycerate dehydrogenase [Liquorilactobacillus satsumensis]|uniref:NAD(P)-dependent oxidoreductase n=2 Tax=Liquorilactobacillus satsumensis TaxID=259059 RepID=UPI0021C2C6C9|nr:NAD(P)-dependent oxidoreductase [Liquorilactobacillus satsumensis]MCP9313108.1 phosphoglycerate dehydrogenase [Liquorilactobacillus satsumensis]MCP9359292.1 phosphoglycerate dehydrogenase [Liquorilactobacillus satsumensis]
MTKVLLLVEPKTEQLQQLKSEFPTATFTTDPADCRDAEIILGWKADLAATILKNEQLQWIQAKSAGVDYFPLRQLEGLGITLTNASGLHSRYIAETVSAYLLIENRGLRPVIKEPGQWIEPAVLETASQRVIIFGTGHIGQEIARYCRFFGMHVTGINRHGSDEHLSTLFDDVITMQQFAAEDELLVTDYVINILPGTGATTHFFDEKHLQKFTSGYTFINVGRGTTVVTSDLQKMLATGYLRSAYLDVFEQEPLPASSALWRSPQVIATPHISGLMQHFRVALYPLFVDNLRRYFAGTHLRNVVDYQKEY